MGINKVNSVIILKDILVMRKLNLCILLTVLRLSGYTDYGTKGYYGLVIILLKRASQI